MNRSSRLRQFIAHESETLKAILRVYLYRAGLNTSEDDLLSDVVVEALRHESRFQEGRQPRAWLLGIAANLIRRRQAEQARLHRREPLVRDLYADQDSHADDLLFDRVAALAHAVSDTADAQLDVETLLSHIPADDAQVLRLAILNELDGADLGAALGISPGAARVRLHRALKRLRDALPTTESETRGSL